MKSFTACHNNLRGRQKGRCMKFAQSGNAAFGRTDSKVEIIKYGNSCHKALELLTKQRNWESGTVFSDVKDVAREEIFFSHYCGLKNIFKLSSNFYQFYKIRRGILRQCSHLTSFPIHPSPPLISHADSSCLNLNPLHIKALNL